MIQENISFPHPVLGLQDDIAGNFSLDIKVGRKIETKEVEFSVINLQLENQYFIDLIANKEAALLIKIYCSSTFKTWSFLYTEECKFFVDENDVCNKVEIEPMIIAVTDIENFCDESFNSQFGGISFSVKKYDTIGLLGKITVPIDKNYEQLGLGNIFEFSPEEDSSKPLSFELAFDKILIKYPVTPMGDHPHSALFHKAPWTSFNIFIVPALAEAFRLMKDHEKKKECEDKEWYFVLNNLLPEPERLDDPFKDAQIVLEKQIPLLKAYEELCTV